MPELQIIRQLPDGRYELDIGGGRRVRTSLYRCPECQQVKPENEFNPLPMPMGRAEERRSGGESLCLPCYSDFERRERERWNAEYSKSESFLREQRQWKERAVAVAQARADKRAAALLAATPIWVDRGAIAAIYREAREKTEILGIMQHVDHIWPIQHRDFCGLHVPWNLRVIDARDNCRKNNKRPDEIVLDGIRS